MIHTCLAKDPNERWQGIGDVARQLRWLQSGAFWIVEAGCRRDRPDRARRGGNVAMPRSVPAPLAVHALLFQPENNYLTGGAGKQRGLDVGEVGSSSRFFLFDPDPSLPAGAAATLGVYASGHLLYVRERVLMARPFDASSRSLQGEAFKVADPSITSRQGSRRSRSQTR